MAFGRVSFYPKRHSDNVVGDFELSGGFWYAAAPDYRIVLPLVLKG
jgi:hypothetical protein